MDFNFILVVKQKAKLVIIHLRLTNLPLGTYELRQTKSKFGFVRATDVSGSYQGESIESIGYFDQKDGIVRVLFDKKNESYDYLYDYLVEQEIQMKIVTTPDQWE